MTEAMLAGAAVGAGIFLLIRTLVGPAPSVGVLVARLDAASRNRKPMTSSAVTAEAAHTVSVLARWRKTVGERLEREGAMRGWQLRRVRSDLALLGRSVGELLATKMFLAVGALLWVPALWEAMRLFGIGLPPVVPVFVGLAAAALAFVLPDLVLHGEAAERRKDFRHVVGSFLDLVAMNLAGGRGLPEALLAASSVSEHWAMVRIRQALANARLVGNTPWEGLGALGVSVGVEELSDLAGTLALAADDGAKIRASLSARAASLRRRELADIEGRAGERSQSMLVAEMLICASFLVFLAYPAAFRILHS